MKMKDKKGSLNVNITCLILCSANCSTKTGEGLDFKVDQRIKKKINPR